MGIQTCISVKEFINLSICGHFGPNYLKIGWIENKEWADFFPCQWAGRACWVPNGMLRHALGGAVVYFSLSTVIQLNLPCTLLVHGTLLVLSRTYYVLRFLMTTGGILFPEFPEMRPISGSTILVSWKRELPVSLILSQNLVPNSSLANA